MRRPAGRGALMLKSVRSRACTAGMRRRRFTRESAARPAASLLLSVVLLVACGTSAQPDDAAIVSDFNHHQSTVEVTADGTVTRLLPDRTSGTGTHEQFIITLSSGGLTIEVEHNISIGMRAPVKEGDHVLVHGEYVWNAQGGLIHFTHHDPQGTHEGGYIQDGGTTYN